jgi:hypothetical protein
MSALTRFLPSERRALAADALLLTTAASAAVLGLITLVAEEAGDSGWYSWVSSLSMLGVVLVCPYLAWRLHGRSDSTTSAVGAAVGFLGGGSVLWVVMMAVAGVALAVSWATGDVVSDGVVALVIVGGLLVALVLGLDIDAVRDLSGGHRHVGTDVGRLLATFVGLVTAVVAVWYTWDATNEGAGELLAFGLASGVVGAVVALGADLASDVRTAGASG